MYHPENDKRYKGLSVKQSPENPGNINPGFNSSHMEFKQRRSVNDYVQGILSGNRVILSEAVTLLESMRPEHEALAQEILVHCLPYAGKSMRIGISGVPGSGKSTTIDSLGMHALEKYGGKLAVLAVDPSSERSKGSILGDKTRMERLAVHPHAFVRPTAARGSLGGVARKTRETIILCEAAGFDKIFVETVGVGQSETACQSMVDFFLLIQLTGEGDELQGIKRGIMEMADGIAVNKCDGANEEPCRLAAKSLVNALRYFPLPPSGRRPEVICYSGFFGKGIPELWSDIEKYFQYVKDNGYFNVRRQEQNRYWMYETINAQLYSHFYDDVKIKAELQVAENNIQQGKQTSFAAAAHLLDIYFGKGKD